jgi:hypothetical protein
LCGCAPSIITFPVLVLHTDVTLYCHGSRAFRRNPASRKDPEHRRLRLASSLVILLSALVRGETSPNTLNGKRGAVPPGAPPAASRPLNNCLQHLR